MRRRGRTRVPVFGRDSTSPLATSTLTASRTTVRLTSGFVEEAVVGERVSRLQLAVDDPDPDLVHDRTVQAAPRVGPPFSHTIIL